MSISHPSSTKGLIKWVRETLNDEEREEKCTAMAVVHVLGAGAEKEVYTMPLNSSRVRTPEEIVQVCYNRAITYSEEIPGAQTFNLVAICGNDKTFCKPFIIHVAPRGAELTTEEPSERGVTKMNMRHTDQAVTLAWRRQEQLDAGWAQLLSTSLAMNAQLSDDRHTLSEQLWRLQNETATRNYEIEEKRKKEERTARMLMLAVTTVGPFVAQKLLGGAIPPQMVAALASQLGGEAPGEGAETTEPLAPGESAVQAAFHPGGPTRPPPSRAPMPVSATGAGLVPQPPEPPHFQGQAGDADFMDEEPRITVPGEDPRIPTTPEDLHPDTQILILLKNSLTGADDQAALWAMSDHNPAVLRPMLGRFFTLPQPNRAGPGKNGAHPDSVILDRLALAVAGDETLAGIVFEIAGRHSDLMPVLMGRFASVLGGGEETSS